MILLELTIVAKMRRRPGHTSSELRDEVLAAFWTLGGRKWLVRAARKAPGLVLPLFAKILPAETKHTLEAHYTTQVAIRVEARETGPGEALDALPPAQALLIPVEDDGDDWLALPAPPVKQSAPARTTD